MFIATVCSFVAEMSAVLPGYVGYINVVLYMYIKNAPPLLSENLISDIKGGA
jgi:hypothetical protein